MKCPHCNQSIVQNKGAETHLRINGPVVFDADGSCKAPCYWCKKPVQIPIALKTKERLVMRTGS